MLRISEYVSLGHPDKIADYISQYLLDRYITHDPDTRYAVEVQIKDSHVTLGGEVASKAKFTNKQLRQFVRRAVCEIGYTREYQARWGRENVICGEDLNVHLHLSQQSPDIAQGLTGWGDQGIFFGFCDVDNPDTHGMPIDHDIAKIVCKSLFDSGLGGLDIKTQVVMEDEGTIKKLIVAIPLLHDTDTAAVEQHVRTRVGGDYELIINGTGRYVRHSSIADCGTTGRKLAVDFYGGNCRIGGGSPWTKDASKADLTLNLAARHFAIEAARKYKRTILVSLACCIGKQEVDRCIQDTEGNVLKTDTVRLDPRQLREQFLLDTPIYASMCRWGLFGEFQQDKQWEK
jgi:S-adenosylmethionine synthetase